MAAQLTSLKSRKNLKVYRMNHTTLLAVLELKETLRARWYQLYILTVSAMISLFFYFGLMESRVLGFIGLGRLLLTLIQICIVILPIFTLMTTVRTFVGDRETGVWEYNLSIPVKLFSFYWGRGIGRYLSLFLPLFVGISLAAIVTLLKGYPVPWKVMILYLTFIGANLLCFTGIALCLSIFSKSQEMALGLAFILWMIFEALIDALLLGLMLKQRIIADAILAIAFFNPLQAFRMAAIALFDPELTILGPIAYTIIEKFGLNNLILWAIFWPSFVGVCFAIWGYIRFKKHDLI